MMLEEGLEKQYNKEILEACILIVFNAWTKEPSSDYALKLNDLLEKGHGDKKLTYKCYFIWVRIKMKLVFCVTK